MPNLFIVATRTSVTALSLVLAGMAALGLSSTERLLGQSVSAGLVTAQARTPSLPVAGSESFWLSSHEAEGVLKTASLGSKPVALGDRITIASGSGSQRVWEVVELRPISGSILPTAAGTPTSAQLLLVTCRDVGAASVGGNLMRIVIEGEGTGEPHQGPARDRLL